MATSQQLLHHAHRCHEEGRFVAAADFLLEAFRADPDDSVVARELGKVLRSVGDLDGAVAYLKRAWQHEPTDSVTVAELVLALHEQGRGQEAVQVMLGSLEAGLEEADFALKLMRS
jgi:Flp pilus assembly protein TadD